jgi:hypothetical protein
MADSKVDKAKADYDEGYRKGVENYKDREGNRVEKFITQKIVDPADKLIFGDQDKSYVEGYKKARQEKLGYKKGGSVGSASKRADGCVQRGKTRGKIV